VKNGKGAPVREWATFHDPRESGRRWMVDLTFLSSSWRCVFGCGCQGTLTAPAPEMEQGCCSYGAHFSGEADLRRVTKAAKRLTNAEWQFADRGRSKGIAARRKGGEWRTRLADGACIFLNRPDFPAGAGCALHLLALRLGKNPLTTKPDVCWQLPLRRIDRTEDDGTVTSTLTEFGREGWGPGGDEFAWWCTEAPEAFTATVPVYQSLEPELRAMVGDVLYDRIAAHLAARTFLPHPTVRRRG
jgi:hypothetical protein